MFRNRTRPHGGEFSCNVALKFANAGFALDSLNFPNRAFSNGNPDWFLPLVGGWYRLRDRMDRALA